MMIDHAQKDAMINISMTNLTTIVARAKSAHMEKSISCANARVSASICLLFLWWPFFIWPCFAGNLAQFHGESQ
ncbi:MULTISPECIES: hypothetical protein [Roseovarius]|uniref:hypothetical protein n=2 Tax=Roseobacteraceae TaxID=2854170 RepID=UPI0020C75017|nr:MULTISPECIES: hypothetical protein [Roseovarius]